MFIYKVDEYIINKFQMAYDYFWNNWGLTKGMVLILLFTCFLTICFYIDLNKSSGYLPFIMLLFILNYFFFKWHEKQLCGNYKYLNFLALCVRESVTHMIFRLFVAVFFVIGDVLTTNLDSFIKNVFMFIIFYVYTVMIKDRETPRNYSRESFNAV